MKQTNPWGFLARQPSWNSEPGSVSDLVSTIVGVCGGRWGRRSAFNIWSLLEPTEKSVWAYVHPTPVACTKSWVWILWIHEKSMVEWYASIIPAVTKWVAETGGSVKVTRSASLTNMANFWPVRNPMSIKGPWEKTSEVVLWPPETHHILMCTYKSIKFRDDFYFLETVSLCMYSLLSCRPCLDHVGLKLRNPTASAPASWVLRLKACTTHLSTWFITTL